MQRSLQQHYERNIATEGDHMQIQLDKSKDPDPTKPLPLMLTTWDGK
jgi:hypothetical protein